MEQSKEIKKALCEGPQEVELNTLIARELQNSVIVQNGIYSQNNTETNVLLNRLCHFMGIVTTQLISIYHLRI